jgi:plastocyanin
MTWNVHTLRTLASVIAAACSLAVEPDARIRPLQEEKTPAADVEDLAKQLVVMVRGKIDDTSVIGAGIIFGIGQDRIYVVTANHVVRQGPQNEITGLEVLFKWLPGEWIPARLLADASPELDLAVIAILNAGSVLPARSLPFDRLAADIKRTDQVFTIGYPAGQPWFSRVTPDTAATPTSDAVPFETTFLQQGHSGGALVNRDWEIVGLIKQDQPPVGVAVRMERVIEQLKRWGYVVSLTAHSAATTATKPSPSGESSRRPSAASVTGTVTFDGKVPTLRPLAMVGDPACAMKHSAPVPNEMLVLGNGNTMGNILVWVSKGLPAGRTFPVPDTPVTLDQNGCLYKPHVMGIMVGQTYRILNSDGVLHNIHTLPKVNAPFNKGMPPTLKEATTVFNKPEEVFHIKCDVHPWMSAYIAVFTHPFFSVTGTDGNFTISGLDPGAYEITAWHEKLGSQTASVTVGANETKARNFMFTVPATR